MKAPGSYQKFTEGLAIAGGIDYETARKVTDFYLANKIARRAHGGSAINVTHGAFLDREVILRAVKQI